MKDNVTSLTDWDDYRKGKMSKGTGFYGEPFSSSNKKPLAPIVKCAHSHPALSIGEYKIYGGSCSDPVVKDADVYVGFEYGMKESTNYPWTGKHSFMFHIQDGSVPVSIEDFRKLIDFLATNLKDGKKVHIGCIGGHGRTGLVLAALVTHMTGNKNSIAYVRTNYCEKSVETNTQIDWLNKHFDIDKVAARKNYSAGGFGGVVTHGTAPKSTGTASYGVSKPRSFSGIPPGEKMKAGFTLHEVVKPVRVKGNVWGF